MSNNRTYQPVRDTIAWEGAALADGASWLTQVTPENIRDMEAALAGVRARGLRMEAITQADFPLPSLAARLAVIARGIEAGHGFALLRGLPVGAGAWRTRRRSTGAFPPISARQPRRTAGAIGWWRCGMPGCRRRS